MDITELINSKEYIILDGAMGTMLQAHGLKAGQSPMLMNITSAETVESIHRMYIEAGSDIVFANTFGANALMLKKTGYSPTIIITAAIEAAKRAAASASAAASTSAAVSPSATAVANATAVAVALDVGPTGDILEPYGELEFEEAYEVFKEMAIIGENAGADLVVIETMSDPEELRAAMTAVRDNTNLPIFATMTFEKSGFTFMGCTPEKFAQTAENLGAVAVGLNCSLEPQQMYEIAKRIKNTTGLPLIVKPNAGLPDAVSGEYRTEAARFAEQMLPYAEIGAKIIGGCCGTTPEYIKELVKTFNA